MRLQQGRRQQSHDVIPFDESAMLVEQEATIEVPVPGNAEVGPVRANRCNGRRPVFLEHGVGNAVREMTVRFVVNLDEFERQVRLQLIDDEAGTAVAGIHDDLQGL
jgi:hypothetical protein